MPASTYLNSFARKTALLLSTRRGRRSVQAVSGRVETIFTHFVFRGLAAQKMSAPQRGGQQRWAGRGARLPTGSSISQLTGEGAKSGLKARTEIRRKQDRSRRTPTSSMMRPRCHLVAVLMVAVAGFGILPAVGGQACTPGIPTGDTCPSKCDQCRQR